MLVKNGPEPYAKKCIFSLAFRFVLKDNYLRELYGLLIAPIPFAVKA